MRCRICDFDIVKPEWDDERKEFLPCDECNTWVKNTLEEFSETQEPGDDDE